MSANDALGQPCRESDTARRCSLMHLFLAQNTPQNMHDKRQQRSSITTPRVKCYTALQFDDVSLEQNTPQSKHDKRRQRSSTTMPRVRIPPQRCNWMHVLLAQHTPQSRYDERQRRSSLHARFACSNKCPQNKKNKRQQSCSINCRESDTAPHCSLMHVLFAQRPRPWLRQCHTQEPQL